MTPTSETANATTVQMLESLDVSIHADGVYFRKVGLEWSLAYRIETQVLMAH